MQIDKHGNAIRKQSRIAIHIPMKIVLLFCDTVAIIECCDA